MRLFMTTQSEYSPWFSKKPPRQPSSYPKKCALLRFQCFSGNKFGQRSESQGSMVGNNEYGRIIQSWPPRNLYK